MQDEYTDSGSETDTTDEHGDSPASGGDRVSDGTTGDGAADSPETDNRADGAQASEGGSRQGRSRRAIRTSGTPQSAEPVVQDIPVTTGAAAGGPGTVTSGSGTPARRKASAPAGPPRPAPEPVPDAAVAEPIADTDTLPVTGSEPGAGTHPDRSGTEPVRPAQDALLRAEEVSPAPAADQPTDTPEEIEADPQADTDGPAEAATEAEPEAPQAAPEAAAPEAVAVPEVAAPEAIAPEATAPEATAPGEGVSERTDAGQGEDRAGTVAPGTALEPRPAGLMLVFQPPAPETTRRRAASRPAGPPPAAPAMPVTFASPDEAVPEPAPRPARPVEPVADPGDEAATDRGEQAGEDLEGEGEESSRRRRRRGGRGRRRRTDGPESRSEDTDTSSEDTDQSDTDTDDSDADNGSEPSTDTDTQDSDTQDTGTGHEGGQPASGSRRRRRRRRSPGEDTSPSPDDPPNTVTRVRRSRADEVTGVKGSTRLEAKRQRRREGRESGRRRHVLTEAEFLARRESVVRTLLVRERDGLTQIVVLEDDVLVEHYVARKTAASMIGNVYLGRVQNVLPSMEAAFIDIGKGRNAVLYAGEVNWDAAGLEGQPRRIELALKSGDPVLVQVSKDPIGHKGARLTSQISLPGRYLVYVPNSSITGISRKLPDTERSRLKKILRAVVPEEAGVIVRTAAEGASEAELERDVVRLRQRWEEVAKRSKAVNPPSLLLSEPDLTIKVIRDVFNEDFKELVVSGDHAAAQVTEYVQNVAPDLSERVRIWDGEEDLFAAHRVDEQIAKALDRKVWLPSGGSLVIDRTEAMTVVDVNTGKFVGSGGNLEETVTRNNLEAAEEIVRQLRLRDIGGIIVVDFIDMVLEANRDLVLRRLVECLGRDRTKHQVAEVTSLGLVQMTRKRMGQGLLEAFSHTCEHCGGQGVLIHDDLTPAHSRDEPKAEEPKRSNEAAKVAQAARKAKERERAHEAEDNAESPSQAEGGTTGPAADGSGTDTGRSRRGRRRSTSAAGAPPSSAGTEPAQAEPTRTRSAAAGEGASGPDQSGPDQPEQHSSPGPGDEAGAGLTEVQATS